MQSTRRQALPLRVHQLWDAISKSPNQVTDFEKLLEVGMTMHKVPKDELNQELNLAIKDGLIVTEAAQTQRHEETEIYKLPDVQTLERGDHDWYCFQCHLGGPIVKCEDCPRVFHLDCLPDDRKPDKDLFVCPPCHIIATKPSAERINLKAKPLNQLIDYVCIRFQAWSADWLEAATGANWAVASERSEKEAWRYKILVYLPMDFDTMRDKAVNAKYQSLEEFQVDCETLIHAIGVYFGADALKGNALGAAFTRDAMHDIQEIKLCHNCFRRSNEKDDENWFCYPCTPPHDVVWAKQTGYPFWPAKVMKREGNKYDVRYFGGNYERANLDHKNIKAIDTPLSQLKVRRTANWNDAYDELQRYQEVARNPASANEILSRSGKGNSASKKTNKRAASSATNEDSVPKKSRKSEPAVASNVTPAKSSVKKTAASAKAVMKTKESSPKTNGSSTAVSSHSTKKKAPTAVVGTPTRRDSSIKESSVSVFKGRRTPASKLTSQLLDISLDESLDPDLRNLLLEMNDDDSVGGDVSFSDDETSEPNEKVSEDVVSSSCNEMKSTRNAYVQVSRPGTKEVNLERLSNYITQLKDQHKSDIDSNKKKQWCYNCGREAIYHCCWNTAYCSIDCQQMHWTSEHKRLCRRKKTA